MMSSSNSVFTTNSFASIDDLEALADDIATHAISAEQARNDSQTIEIKYDDDGTVIEVAKWSNGNRTADPDDFIVSCWQPIVGQKVRRPDGVKTLFDLKVDSDRRPEDDDDLPNRLGGSVPKGFKIPETRNPVGLQYIATLTPNGPFLPFLTHPLHVVYPLFVKGHFFRLSLDYSDPMAPVFVDQDGFEDAIRLHDLDYSGLKNPSGITYGADALDVVLATPYDYDTHVFDKLGRSGTPAWINSPRVVECPKSGKPMEFVVQFESTDWLLTSMAPFDGMDPDIVDRFETLNFWDDGVLYVFYAPETKIMTAFIETT
jgi:hypothetical protein